MDDAAITDEEILNGFEGLGLQTDERRQAVLFEHLRQVIQPGVKVTLTTHTGAAVNPSVAADAEP